MDEFLTALGAGEPVGTVRDGHWECDCGKSGDESDETVASMALYFHRRSGHRDVEVEFPAKSDG